MTFLLCAVLLVSANPFAGTAGSGQAVVDNRAVEAFHSIDARGAYALQLSVGKSTTVEVSGDDNLVALLTTRVEGGVLRIDHKGHVDPKVPLVVKVQTPSLQAVAVHGAVHGSGALGKAANLALEASGAAHLTLQLDAGALAGKARGAAHLTLSGRAGSAVLESGGAAHVDGAALKLTDLTIKAQGSSRVTAAGSGAVDVVGGGSARITLVGKPRKLTKELKGSSALTP